MEQFLTYFPSAFSWGNLAVLILGSAGGLFFGAMPGLSPTMAVALLVPFTFYLPADTSLILLGAVYTSAVAGGSISAILLSIPGAPSSIATLFDGYPMAKQGRAQEALYTVFVSSLIGGVFGVLVMILFSPPMAEFAMRFGPPELFWTAIFGITVITGLSSGAMLKGLFGGALGMLLSTVGYSTLTGEPRFVIHEALNGGIALVPALIGLFAVPQIIDLMADSHVLLEKLTFKPQKGMLRQVIKAHRRYLRTLSIGSLIGTIIGSIPGSPTAAVLLGGLLIHGLFPGPDLFTEKADITYTFISGLLLAQFFMCFFGLLASRYSHLVANAPNYMMFAAVMILCVFGSYCVQNSYEDVILMFILGVLMFVLAKFGFPSAPIVLGIILGPIAEENFLRGKMIADTDVGVFSYFFTGGLNLALIALCLLSLFWGIYSEVKYMRNHSRKAAAAN